VQPILGDFLVEDKGVARHATDQVAKELVELTARRALTMMSA
jgi:hypothetical protein